MKFNQEVPTKTKICCWGCETKRRRNGQLNTQCNWNEDRRKTTAEKWRKQRNNEGTI